jgi:short-subunit dehydrogenase
MPDPEAKRTALVTGASAGIGKAFAEVFAREGFDLVLTARRADRLESIAADLRQRHGTRVHVVAADLADPAAPARIAGDLFAAGITIDALVNNAGYGVPGTFTETTWSAQRDMLQVMVMAPAELTHRFLPGMLARRYGRIINVASVAGLVPQSAGHALYGASKSLVIKFSQAIALEGLPHNVFTTAVCPGFTYSEFHDVNGMRPQVSQLPSWMWMDAATVAQQAYDAVMAGRLIYVNGLVNRTMVLLARYLPEWLVMGVLKRVAGKFRKA